VVKSKRGWSRLVRFTGLIFVAFAPSSPLLSQTAPPAPAISQPPSTSTGPAATGGSEDPAPGAIYKQAMHPLDVVRGSLENWSDAELGALSVGMHQAREACDRAKPENYAGDDLYDLGRLCSFGQDWNAANAAALAYIASGAEPHRAQAYVLSESALVHINAVDLAVETAREMLFRLPYDAEVAYGLLSLKSYLALGGSPAALKLATEEHPSIISALEQGAPLKAAQGEGAIGLGALYESAMEMAFLERYNGDDKAATTTAAEVEAALGTPPSLGQEDRLRIESVHAQYQLLGTRLPEIKVIRSLRGPNAKAQINSSFGYATVFVLFPDWCVQCRKMMKTLTAFAVVNGTTPIHAYGLIFQEDADSNGQSLRDAEMKELQGTATLLVPAETSRTFGAIDYPLGIVVDKSGLIRYIGAIPEDAFNGNGFVNRFITQMAARSGFMPKTTKTGGAPKAN